MKDNWKKYEVRHNDRNISEVLGDVIGSNKRLKKGFATTRIQNAWKIEMGDMINSYTQKMYYFEGVLTVYLISAPLRNELNMSREKVIEIINTACQERLINKIIFR